MKALIGKILSFIGLGIVILFSLVFTFIELRTLLAGDYALFNSPVLGFFSYFFRSVFFLGMFSNTLALAMYVGLKEEKERYLTLLIIGVGLFVGSFMSLLFYAWFIALIIIAVSLIPVIVALLNFIRK